MDDDVVELYLSVAGIVVEAVADPGVGAAWDRPSVLEHQTIGSLAGHLMCGGVWLVGEYLDGGVPSGPAARESAGDYCAAYMDRKTEATELAIRDRGAAIAEPGHRAVVDDARGRLVTLGPRLRATPTSQLVAVVDGLGMRLGDYLETRLVEQVVHLDDLACSLDRDPYPVPEAAMSLVLSIGTDVARRRSGDAAVLRAFYRHGFANDVFPIF